MRKFSLLIATTLFTGVAMADDKPLDVTIQVFESPTDLPVAVTKKIQLPPNAAERARERAQRGLDIANDARARTGGVGVDPGGLPSSGTGALPDIRPVLPEVKPVLPDVKPVIKDVLQR